MHVKILILITFFSLYPTITLKECYQFPIGHPLILKAPHELALISIQNGKMCYDRAHIEGLIKLKILPSKTLIPFLLMKHENKSLGVCCRTCAIKNQQTVCRHNSSDRALIDVYCINEIVYAVEEVGYTILEIYEVYAYKESAQLFQNFMKFLGAKKIRHSGFDRNINTMDEKEAYCEKINAAMQFEDNIKLKPDNIDNNEYQRTATKAGLNSVLGKYY